MTRAVVGGGATNLTADKRAILSQRLRGRAASTTGSSLVPEGREPPPSSGQERLWFMEQLAPGSTAYTVPLAMRLRGELDTALLEDALTTLVARHEALRMRFLTTQDGQPRVVVDEPGPVVLKITEASTAERAVELVGEELTRPFNLETDPLLRAVLVRIEAGDHMLLLAVHHIVSDGRSLEIMAEELLDLYGGLREGTPAVLPEPPVQYGDFAAWQRERLAGPPSSLMSPIGVTNSPG